MGESLTDRELSPIRSLLHGIVTPLTYVLVFVADSLANACTDYRYHDRTVIDEQMPCRCASPLLFPHYNVPHIKHWPRAQDTEWFERLRAERQSREISHALRDMLFSSNTCL